MLRTATCLAIVLTSTLATADTAKDVTSTLETIASGSSSAPAKMAAPRFAVSGLNVQWAPESADNARSGMSDIGQAKKAVVGISADKTAAWINADVAEFIVCGMGDCYKKPDAWAHGTALFEVKGTTPIAWQIAEVTTGKAQAAAIEKGATLAGLDEHIEKGAEDPVKLFKDSLGDPKKLAATVSDRKDSVLYGSELGERFVGGAKIKSQLTKWGLAFTVIGGVQAAVTKSQTVAFVAAAVEAKSIKKANAKASTYRVLAIYEKTITSWKIVSINFTFATD